MAFPLRLMVLVTLGGLTACAEEVVLGQFLERGDGGANADGGDNTDGGAIGGTAGGAAGGNAAGGNAAGGNAAGGNAAGGNAAGGSTAGGNAAGGNAAGGNAAGGNTAGGSTAGGSAAGGSTAGGSTAGGSAAGGSAADAGPELSVAISGPLLVTADAGPQPWQLTVTNSGTVGVVRPAIRLQVRPAANFTGCEDAGVVAFDGGMEIICRATDALAGGVGTASFSLELGTTLRFTDLTADVLPVTGELDSTNNRATRPVGVTQVGVVPVTILPPEPRLADVMICAGTLITSWAQCVPGSRIGFQFQLLADGGWGEADAGVRAEWFSANEGRNIAFINPTGPGTAGYLGASVSPLCFEGVIQTTVRVYGGAFRACLQ